MTTTQLKKLLLLLTLAFTINVNAQDSEKTVTLVVSGQGKTQDEAKQNALRSAIEQAFGAFISSKTEILNDNLIKDEIVSIANGNIQKYEVISEVKIPDGGYATTLKAIVSVSKLTNFCSKKGVSIEFNGGLYAINTRLDNLNSEAEVKAVESLVIVCEQLLSNSIDYTLEYEEPKCKDNECTVLFKVIFNLNNNFNLFDEYFRSTIKKIGMGDEEQNKYIENNKDFFPLVFGKMTANGPKIKDYNYFRNHKSIEILDTLLFNASFAPFQFYIKCEAGKFTMADNTVGEIDFQKSNLVSLSYGFPSATNIQFRKQGNVTQTTYGKEALKLGIGGNDGILVLPFELNSNAELGYLVLKKKMTLNEIGGINKFEIRPISKN